MNFKAIFSLSKSGLLDLLGGQSGFVGEGCSVEMAEGEGSSIVVSLSVEEGEQMLVAMNGREVEAEVVMFSLD